MVEILGFDYDIREFSDGKFGHVTELGKWTGMIRDLMDITGHRRRTTSWITYPHINLIYIYKASTFLVEAYFS